MTTVRRMVQPSLLVEENCKTRTDDKARQKPTGNVFPRTKDQGKDQGKVRPSEARNLVLVVRQRWAVHRVKD